MKTFEDKKTVDHWYELLKLKNYLVRLSSEELCQYASDNQFFHDLVVNTIDLIDEEPVFLMLDISFLAKVSKVLEVYRFSEDKKGEFQNVNYLIEKINDLNSVPYEYRMLLVSNYRYYQLEARNVYEVSDDDFIELNANDAVVYEEIWKGDFQLSDENIFSSLNYFTVACPECFMDDTFYEKVEKFFDGYEDGISFFDKHIFRRNDYKECVKIKQRVYDSRKGS